MRKITPDAPKVTHRYLSTHLLASPGKSRKKQTITQYSISLELIYRFFYIVTYTKDL